MKLVSKYPKRFQKLLVIFQVTSNRALLLNNCIAGHAMLFKKELLHYVFPFPTTIPHDHWIAYIALTIGRIRYFNKVPGILPATYQFYNIYPPFKTKRKS